MITPTFLNSSILLLTFLSFTLLCAKLIILRQGKYNLLSTNKSIHSSVRALYDRFILVALLKCQSIRANPCTVSLFLSNFRHFIGFYWAADSTRCTSQSSFSSQPVISNVSLLLMNQFSILSAKARFYSCFCYSCCLFEDNGAVWVVIDFGGVSGFLGWSAFQLKLTLGNLGFDLTLCRAFTLLRVSFNGSYFLPTMMGISFTESISADFTNQIFISFLVFFPSSITLAENASISLARLTLISTGLNVTLAQLKITPSIPAAQSILIESIFYSIALRINLLLVYIYLRYTSPLVSNGFYCLQNTCIFDLRSTTYQITLRKSAVYFFQRVNNFQMSCSSFISLLIYISTDRKHFTSYSKALFSASFTNAYILLNLFLIYRTSRSLLSVILLTTLALYFLPLTLYSVACSAYIKFYLFFQFDLFEPMPEIHQLCIELLYGFECVVVVLPEQCAMSAQQIAVDGADYLQGFAMLRAIV